jgi:RNA polymerase sigma factor (sigma-70 family)
MSSDRAPSALEPVTGQDPSGEIRPTRPPSEAHAERMAALFRQEHSKVVHYLVARTKSWQEARDIAAQAFSQVLAMKDPESVGSLKAYIYKAAKNLSTNWHTLGAIRRRLNGIVRHELPSTSPPPEPLLFDEQRLELLQQAIQRLRPSRREVLLLRFWDRLPYEDIVRRLEQKGVSVNVRTVRRWVADAVAECGEAIRAAEGEADQ